MGNRSTSLDDITGMLEAYKRLTGLQERLDSLSGRLERTHEYLQRAGGDLTLAKAHRDRLISQCRTTLAGLREARMESRRLLGLA